MLQRADTGDTFVVAVVVDQGNAGELCGATDQQIGGRYAAMLAAAGLADFSCARHQNQGAREGS